MLLNNSDPLDGDFNPQITACNHDAVGCVEDIIQMVARCDALEFGDNKGLMTQISGGPANGLNVLCSFHKRLADGIHPIFQGKFQTFVISIGKCTDPQIYIR